MSEERQGRHWGGVVGGTVMIVLGVAFLVEQLGFATVRFWSAWPLILIILGAVKLSTGRSWGARKTGLVLVGIGVWLWASHEGWAGLTWRSSWPLLLILFGTLAVVEAVFGLKDEGSC
jgi:hypothetical protein